MTTINNTVALATIIDSTTPLSILAARIEIWEGQKEALYQLFRAAETREELQVLRLEIQEVRDFIAEAYSLIEDREEDGFSQEDNDPEDEWDNWVPPSRSWQWKKEMRSYVTKGSGLRGRGHDGVRNPR